MPRILIADDDPPVRDLLARLLEVYDHETATACDAETALETFDDFRPDVLICDLAMPSGGGLHVTQELRARGEACPIVLLTGYAQALGAEQLRDLDIAALLPKPLDFAVLLRGLEEAMRRAQVPRTTTTV